MQIAGRWPHIPYPPGSVGSALQALAGTQHREPCTALGCPQQGRPGASQPLALCGVFSLFRCPGPWVQFLQDDDRWIFSSGCLFCMLPLSHRPVCDLFLLPCLFFGSPRLEKSPSSRRSSGHLRVPIAAPSESHASPCSAAG